MPSHFKFKEYCPLVFRNLRERFGIDDQDFLVWKLLYIHRRQISLAALVMPLGQISTFFCHLCFRRCELPHKRASYLLETIAILLQVYILKCFFTIWCCNDTDEKQMKLWSELFNNYSVAFLPFPLLFDFWSSFIFHSFLENPRSQCRQWVGSTWRSLCPSSVQLSFLHVYIRVRLAAASGQLGMLRHWQSQRNVVTFSTLNYFPTDATSCIVIKSRVGLSSFVWPLVQNKLFCIISNCPGNIPHYSIWVPTAASLLF